VRVFKVVIIILQNAYAYERQLLPGAVCHDEAGVQFLDSPRRREAMVGAALAVLAVLATAVMVASDPP
jgi:hypothetical protein